jgi:hypothetical protein
MSLIQVCFLVGEREKDEEDRERKEGGENKIENTGIYTPIMYVLIYTEFDVVAEALKIYKI